MAERIPTSSGDQIVTGGHPVHSSVHHEESDINVRLVLLGGAICVVLSIIMLFGLWGMFVGFRAIDRKLDPEKVSAVATDANEVSFLEGKDAQVPDFVRHWIIGSEELAKMLDAEDEMLEDWGWIDERSGKVRMPIEEAMSLALQRGYPTRAEGAQFGSVPPPWAAETDEADEMEPETPTQDRIDSESDEIHLDEGESVREATGQ